MSNQTKTRRWMTHTLLSIVKENIRNIKFHVHELLTTLLPVVYWS